MVNKNESVLFFEESMKNICEWYTTAAMHGNWPKENDLVYFSPVQPPNLDEQLQQMIYLTQEQHH